MHEVPHCQEYVLLGGPAHGKVVNLQAGERDGWMPFGSPLQERQAILRTARRAGVQVTSLRTEYHWNYLTKNLDMLLVARGVSLHPLEGEL